MFAIAVSSTLFSLSCPPLEQPERTEPTRIALLHFGFEEITLASGETAPADLVYHHIRADTFRETIPLLEQADPDIIVIRFRTGGGDWRECEALATLFQTEFESRWRTIAWIDQLHASPVLCAWAIDEIVMTPDATVGCALISGFHAGCPPFSDEDHRQYTELCERVSEWGGRDPSILAAMQADHPLSCDTDNEGIVLWRDDQIGEHLVKDPRDYLLKIDAESARRFGIAIGIAESRHDLARVLDLHDVQWVGHEADEHLRTAAVDAEADAREGYALFDLLFAAIEEFRYTHTDPEVAESARKSRRLLKELERYLDARPWAAPLVLSEHHEARHDVLNDIRNTIENLADDADR